MNNDNKTSKMLEGLGIKWEDRYNPINSVQERKIVDYFNNLIGFRGEELEKIIVENDEYKKQENEHYLSGKNYLFFSDTLKYRKPIYEIYGDKGKVVFAIFEPHKSDDYKTKKEYREIEKRQGAEKGLALLKFKQQELNKPDFEGDSDKLESEIDELFTFVFDIKSKDEKGTSGENQFPYIFKNREAFENFEKWMEVPNVEEDKKISFIFQKLKEDNLMVVTSYKQLSNWAFENKFLTKECYDKLNIEGHFTQPSKILNKSRLTIYNSIIGS